MKYLYILFLLLFSFSAIGNNIRVEGKTRVVEFLGNDTAVVEVTLLWDNSWRDDFNWDAAWVFFKYKKRGELNGWHPVLLSSSGHGVTSLPGNEGGGYTFMVGAGGGRVMGLYVLREGISEGNVKVSLRVKWPLSGSGVTKSDFGEDYKGVYVAVHAIEMVYIPYGAYSLGDGLSGKSFVNSGKEPLLIDSEDARSVYTLSSPSTPLSLSSSYPKGYAGFYVMKYEVSQEQYVEFLNSLTLSQQKDRVGNNDFEHMEKGDYVFGDLKHASCRNGIAFISQPRKEGPAVFGNNLNRENDFFSVDDGQTLACNYLSIEDMLSYCSWSGLRPMSELEYEKACRRFYPQVPEKGEYAWNTSSGVNSLQSESELSYRWSENEQALSKQRNVNSGGHVNGPVRCGLFATSSTSQSEAGATYWGVMEMGGNVKELCVNVNYTSFDGSSVGFGEYNPGLWNVSFNNYGVRGGGFSSHEAQLRTSDRTEAEGYFSSSSHRDSTVGFRGIRGISTGNIDAGSLTLKNMTSSICSGSEVVIEGSVPESDFAKRYTWSMKVDGGPFEVLREEQGKNLNYKVENKTEAVATYTFRRKVITNVGENFTDVTVQVIPTHFTLSTYSSVCDFCNGSGLVTALPAVSGLKTSYSWSYGGNVLSTASSYTPAFGHFGGVGTYSVVCKVGIESCPAEEQILSVKVTKLTSGEFKIAQCGQYFADARNDVCYPTLKVGTQCWMKGDLRYGKCQNKAEYAGGNKVSRVNMMGPGLYGVCRDPLTSSDKPAGISPQVGYLYNWQAALQSPEGYYNYAGNPSGNVNGNVRNRWKGICPDGWYLPSGGSTGDLQKLYSAIGSKGVLPGGVWNGVKGGFVGNDGGFYVVNVWAYYWSNMAYDKINAYSLTFSASEFYPQDHGVDNEKFCGMAVRCVKYE